MDDLVKRIQSTINRPEKPNIIAMHVDDAQALLARTEALEKELKAETGFKHDYKAAFLSVSSENAALEARIAKADALAEVAERAIKLSQEHDSFKLYAMEPMWQSLAAYREGSDT